MIPYGRQSIDDDDIAAVVEVLRGDWLTQGPHVAEFEEALAAKVEARHAVAFANGTAALHAACAVAGLGPGDRVATSPLSFIASANCARYVGASVEFIDIDPATLNLDPKHVPDGLDALVAVDFAGLPVDLAALRHRPRVVIEDAAQALGARTPDGPVGACAHADMCCFSFHPVKTITTGEGGAVTTNDPALADALRRFRTHGVSRPTDKPGWYYEVHDLGFNYRLTDIQAALGTSQLRKVETFVARRNELARGYRDGLEGLVELAPAAPDGWLHAYHLFTIRVADRDAAYESLRARGIGVQVHFIPISEHALYRDAGANVPHAIDAGRSLLTLPLHPSLTDADHATVIAAVRDVAGGAER